MQQLTIPDGRPWEPPQPSDALDVHVLAVLQNGRPHDRHDVAAGVVATVRQVRASVSELRRLGWPICLGPNSGYRLSWAEADLDQRKYHSQALSQLRTLNRIRRARRTRAATMFDVPTIEDLVRDKIEIDYMLEHRPA